MRNPCLFILVCFVDNNIYLSLERFIMTNTEKQLFLTKVLF